MIMTSVESFLAKRICVLLILHFYKSFEWNSLKYYEMLVFLGKSDKKNDHNILFSPNLSQR